MSFRAGKKKRPDNFWDCHEGKGGCIPLNSTEKDFLLQVPYSTGFDTGTATGASWKPGNISDLGMNLAPRVTCQGTQTNADGT